MLRTWNLESSPSIPLHIVFEHRPSDAYELEDSSLSATSLLCNEKQPEANSSGLRELPRREAGNNRALSASSTLHTLVPSSHMEAKPLEHGSEVIPAAENTAEPPPLASVQFRQARLEVDDAGVFWEGVVGGQVAAVQEPQPLNGSQVFELFESAVNDLEFSETWLAGYLLGLSDALLRHRKSYPRAYNTHLSALKERRR